MEDTELPKSIVRIKTPNVTLTPTDDSGYVSTPLSAESSLASHSYSGGEYSGLPKCVKVEEVDNKHGHVSAEDHYQYTPDTNITKPHLPNRRFKRSSRQEEGHQCRFKTKRVCVSNKVSESEEHVSLKHQNILPVEDNSDVDSHVSNSSQISEDNVSVSDYLRTLCVSEQSNNDVFEADVRVGPSLSAMCYDSSEDSNDMPEIKQVHNSSGVFLPPIFSEDHKLGQDKPVDFLVKLGEESSHLHIVEQILSYLEPEDLVSASMVSKSWKKLCARDQVAQKRQKSYIEQFRQSKENVIRWEKIQKRKASAPGQSMRKLLSNITNCPLETPAAASTPSSPPRSPSKALFNQFLKEAHSLEKGRSLVRCPRCLYPTQENAGGTLAQCCRSSCAYEFCPKCRCDPHDPRPCTMLGRDRRGRPRGDSVGSKGSRRNLRRLLAL